MNLILFLLFAFSSLAFSEPAVRKSLYTELISKKLSWKVMPYNQNVFKGWNLEDVKRMLRERPVDVTTIKTLASPFSCNPPQEFDGREKFKECIHPALDQAECGSCWAFSIAEVLSDKFCIAGKDVILSPQDLTSCDRKNDGCDGGSIYTGMEYAEEYGVVEEACFPYGSGRGPTPPCLHKCQNGLPWKKYHCRKGTVTALFKIDEMKCALMNGPVSGRFDVYEDFMQYKQGIYEHASGGYIGGHAIKVVGWGRENSINYWICENSWGKDWGENGFFKIKQGDCDIDRYMIDCQPNI